MVWKMTDRVRLSTQQAVADDDLEHVSINTRSLDECAERLQTRDVALPDWRAPVMLDESEYSVEMVFDFFLVGNTLNFVFDDFETRETFATTYDGQRWTGAYAMWASLKRAIESGTDVTSGAVLRDLTLEQTRNIFRGDPPIPLLERRHAVLTHLGERLCEVADGYFHAVVTPENGLALYEDDGDGIVEWLTREFPEAYADQRTYRGGTVYFDKQAKLSMGMVQGRFHNRSEYTVTDFDEMTILADYLIPALLRDDGILEYSEELTRSVETRQLVPEGSRKEVEIRIATIVAGDRLLDRLNSDRDDPLSGFHLDQALWQEARHRELVHHFTETTTY